MLAYAKAVVENDPDGFHKISYTLDYKNNATYTLRKPHQTQHLFSLFKLCCFKGYTASCK